MVALDTINHDYTNACPPQKSQKQLGLKFVPILSPVYGATNKQVFILTM